MTTAEQYRATFGNTEPNTVIEIRGDYYGVGDHLLNLSRDLRMESLCNPDNKALKHEADTIFKALKAFQASELGRIL